MNFVEAKSFHINQGSSAVSATTVRNHKRECLGIFDENWSFASIMMCIHDYRTDSPSRRTDYPSAKPAAKCQPREEQWSNICTCTWDGFSLLLPNPGHYPAFGEVQELSCFV